MSGQHSPADLSPAHEPNPMRVRYFLIVFFISLFFLGKILYPFWSILVLSFILASLFRPIYLFFNKKIPNGISSVLACLLIIALVFIPLVFFILALSNEALTVYHWGRDSRIWLKLQVFIQESPFVAHIQEYLREVGFDFQPAQISESISYLVKMGGLMLYNQASAWAANIAQFFFLFMMMILVIFFLLIDQPRLINFVIKMSPLPDDQDRLLIDKFEEIANAILKGNGICGILQGVLGGAIFSVLGLNSPILWGFIMGILAFLPIFGIGLVMMPAALILAFNERISAGIFMFVFYLFLSFSVEYLLKPKLVGNQVKMHTLLVFLSIIGGLSVYGVLGIIYGPLIVTAFLTLSEIYLEKYDYYVQHH
ncbi:MAG: AI-2E family transporter [Desulfocapsaceae bacterium]|jgi:predicted PurR-regulated permease PerM|nr:AI-2E family transporter [Desulfocapsaceae bacterium]